MNCKMLDVKHKEVRSQELTIQHLRLI